MLDRQAIITRSVLRCLIFGVLYVANSAGFSAIAQSSEVVPALVVYGESKLVEDEEALTDERLSVLLDSLCTLDPAPHSLIRDLRLFQRMRSMGSDQMVLLIDSLFELDTVPYALVNEINLYLSLIHISEPTRPY